MKNRRAPAYSALALLAVAGCQPSRAPSPAQDRAAELQKIHELRDRFTAAYNSGDAAAVAALYTDDAAFMPSNEPSVEGKQAIQALYQRQFGQGPAKITITPQETEIAGEWAYERGSALISVAPKGAKSPVEMSARYLVVLRRQADGDWKVHRDMDNSSSPPEAAAGTGKK